MKIVFILFLFCCFTSNVTGQKTIIMAKDNGVYTVNCTVNGIRLKFILDTGASDVSISLTEALFMLKNGYLKESDIIGTSYSQLANGEITKNTKIVLKEIEFYGLKLKNIKASVVNELSAPLLLGQSALAMLGKIQIDPINNTLTILNASKDSTNQYSHAHDSRYRIVNGRFGVRSSPIYNSSILIMLDSGTEVEILGKESYFYKIKYEDIIGYMSDFFLDKE